MSISPRLFLVSTLVLGAGFPLVSQAQAPAPESLIGKPLPENNGFDAFLAATKLYAGSLGNASTLSTTDLLRFERANVTRNKAAIRKVREGLALPVQHPVVTNYDEDFGGYKEFSKLAELLKQESAVLYSNTDYVGAMNSSLDCIEMGVDITRGGPLRSTTAGRAIEEQGRENLEPIISKLSIQESRDAAARLGKIESLRTQYSDAIRVEKGVALALTRESFEKQDWSDAINAALKANGEGFTEAEKSQLTNAGEDEILGNLTKVLDDAVAGGDTYYKPVRSNVGRAADPWSRMMTDTVASPSYRINYEYCRTQNILLQQALLLRATKMETGKYPETIDLPADPFGNPATGDGKLKYRLEGDSYLLYSVGPNGKDEDGLPAERDKDGNFNVDTKGDLLAPVYAQ